MIRVQDTPRWQSFFGTVLQNSRWTLADELVEGYMQRSFDYVVDYLQHRGEALASGLDPIGEQNLGISKRVRRMALREGGPRDPRVLEGLADDFFPLAPIPFGYWEKRGAA
jgi:hypothetical protein